MEYTSDTYTRFYIVQALFRLMREYEFEKISVTDIAQKAGVGRATFYRYFKRKEEILLYYFEHNKKEFMFQQHFYPRYKDDYIQIVKNVLTMFKENQEQLSLIRKARLEYIYLDYLNRNFTAMFEKSYPNQNAYTPYLYAGMLFNVSMTWLDDNCKESVDTLAQMIVNAIYFA